MKGEQMTISWSVERTVVLLTPVFTGLAAWVTTWIATHFPGHPHVDQAAVVALTTTGAVAGASAVLKWLHGRVKLQMLDKQLAAASPVVVNPVVNRP
jgi:hypothetical protein